MNEYLLVFRGGQQTNEGKPLTGKIPAYVQDWQHWFDQLAARDMLARPVQRLDIPGIILLPNTDAAGGSYSETPPLIEGLVIIKAVDYDAALDVAATCPILTVGGCVEIRLGN
jgi:hypothetical protein